VPVSRARYIRSLQSVAGPAQPIAHMDLAGRPSTECVKQRAGEQEQLKRMNRLPDVSLLLCCSFLSLLLSFSLSLSQPAHTHTHTQTVDDGKDDGYVKGGELVIEGETVMVRGFGGTRERGGLGHGLARLG
jgi:hypothetical protein